jgi:hypothetical protein
VRCNYFILVIGITFCFFFLTPVASAQVLINELHPAPGSGADWIELVNVSSEAVPLSGWSVSDATSPLTPMPSFQDRIIAPAEFLVIEVGSRLNNTGDSVILKNPVGSIIDEVRYTSTTANLSWSRGESGGETWVQQPPTRGSNNLPLPSPTPTPSPSPTVSPSPTPSPTLTPTPSPSPVLFPAEVRLSEIQACPETGEEEWLELYNPGTENYTLTNWKTRDAAGNSRTINTSFPAGTFTVVTWSGSLLNNDGDTVMLERSDGQRMFEFAIPACTRGETFIVINGTLTSTASITKGSANMTSGQVISPVTTLPITSTATKSASAQPTPSPPLTQATNGPNSSITTPTTSPSTPFKLPYLATALQLNRESSNSASSSPPPVIPTPIHPRLLQLAASLCSLGSVVSGGVGLGLWQWYTGFRDRYLEATL